MRHHSVENRENRRRAPSSAPPGGTPPSHDLSGRNRLTPGGASARPAGSVWTEIIVHAYVRECRRRGRRSTTIRGYLYALRHWPDRWPGSVHDLQLALDHLATLSPSGRLVYRTVWRRFGSFAHREFGVPNVPARLELSSGRAA